MRDGKEQKRRTRAGTGVIAKARRVIRNSARTKLITREEARQRLDDAGLTLAEFAAQNGVQYTTVVKVLSGRNTGRFGEAHKVAVLLKLKTGTATIG